MRTITIGLLSLLMGVTVHAVQVRNLTRTHVSDTAAFAIDGFPSHIVAVTAENVGGDNPSHAYRLLTFDPTSGLGTPIATLTDGLPNAVESVTVSDDGTWIGFLSDGNHLGHNPNRSVELLVIRDDGSQLAQLTDDPSPLAFPIQRVRLGGDGSRFVFVSRRDPLGTNAGAVPQAFAIERDGTGLTQLTTHTDGEILDLSVSDDGTRVAYVHDGDPVGGNPDGGLELFVVDGDGGNVRQLTTSAPGHHILHCHLSGDGTLVARDEADYSSTPNFSVHIIDWDGTNDSQLSSGRAPRLDDTGSSAYFLATDSGEGVVRSIRTDGTVPGQVAAAGSMFEMSDNGGWFAFDGIDGLRSARRTGALQFDLVPEELFELWDPDIDPTGSTVVFQSTSDFDGTNPFQLSFVHAIDVTTGVRTTVSGSFADEPKIAGDGTITYFGNGDVFVGDATGSTQALVTPCTGSGFGTFGLDIADSGGRIAFTRDCDPLGLNADGSDELFSVGSDGSDLRQLTANPSTAGRIGAPRVDGSGTWVVFVASFDPVGQNGDGSAELFRARADGSAIEQLTDDCGCQFQVDSVASVDVSGDGSAIVFAATWDPAGTNADGSREIFVWEASTGLSRQLTQNTAGRASYPRISRDGSWVYFSFGSYESFFGPLTEIDEDLYRVRLADGSIERASGLALGGGLRTTLTGPTGEIAVDARDRVVFRAMGLQTPDNADRSLELFLSDFGAPDTLAPSGPAPTRIDWVTVPGAVRHDVVRGDLAALAAVGGGPVSLGSVLCVENDSPDPTTAGFEDLDDPLPGGGFFYVRRDTLGVNGDSGSYGASSLGGERSASVGDCAP